MLFNRTHKQEDPKKHWRREYEQTDFGRRYGWWLCIGTSRVAELNYVRWDSWSQFWHEYRLFPFHPDFDRVGVNPERWAQPDVSLESRYAVGFRQSGILMGVRGPDLVAVRSVCIPEDIFFDILRQRDEKTRAEYERARHIQPTPR